MSQPSSSAPAGSSAARSAGRSPGDGTVVVVGAGLTGATAVQTLREDGYRGRVVLLGQEPERPYERPALSKGYLLGTDERDSVFVHPPQWYAEHDVELRPGTRAAALDRAAHEVVLGDGERVPYTAVLLATGSRPRMLDVPGADLAGVHTLRTLPDADRLLEAFGRGPRVGIVGGGWIGLEVAAAARQAGLDVTVLEAGPLPLRRVLGPEVARVFAGAHREHGVDLRTGVQVAALESADGRIVSGIRLAGGDVVRADLVLVGIGVVPEVGLARDAGLEVKNGVVVDEHLRTADPDVLAAGDVANAWHPVLGRRLRVEHWANAGRQGVVAARTLQGVAAVDDRLPYFYTDQYDLGMEYVGYAEPHPTGGDVVLRGDVAGREFHAFWLREGRVAAGMHVNVWDTIDDVERLIRSGRTVAPDRLADPGVPLAELAENAVP
jgi:3-phenylpropionate/trans-cinnamate dioxygenase ferredoxin reductase component